MPFYFWLLIVLGVCLTAQLSQLVGGTAPNAGLSTLSREIIALLSGEHLNFRPFGHEPQTTGSKRKPFWLVWQILLPLIRESESKRALAHPFSFLLPLSTLLKEPKSRLFDGRILC